MCSNNQALDALKVDLSTLGSIIQQEISVPMDERYELGLQFQFHNRETYDSSQIPERPSGANHRACSNDARYSALSPRDKVEMGAELDFEIIVSATDGKLFQKKRYRSRCIQGWGFLTKSRHFGYVDLQNGKQQITIINHSPVVMENGFTATLFLAGAGAGYP